MLSIIYPEQLNEIVSNIWVGTHNACNSFDGSGICVLEYDHECKQGCIRLPVLNRDSPVADVYPLDCVADAIELALLQQKPVLVHCAQGIERGPLSVAWYLFRKHGMTFNDAYDLVLRQRPIAQDRRVWLSREARAIALPEIAYSED